ncbi:DUF4163 domain-containing protein [Mangrovibacterium diazotrophicum]|nr:DUF4163 domain-containing protein [Mangrovibacterium diazotrophicum]
MKSKFIFPELIFKCSILSMFVYVMFLSACHTAAPKVTVEERTVASKTDAWTVDVQYRVFASSDEAVNASLENLNVQLERYVSAMSDSLKVDAEEIFKSFEADSLPRPSWGYALNVTDTVYMATSEYVSVRLAVYQFTGGAHGMTNFVAFNYDVENQKFLETTDLLDFEKTVAINNLLKENFENPEQCFDIDPTLDLVSSINFSASAAYFTFGHYSLGPYACGPAEVTVSLKDLGESFLLNVAK